MLDTMRSGRGLILLAFAVGTFITLRLTLGPRWHGGHGGCHHACNAGHDGSQQQHSSTNTTAPWSADEAPVR
jgi:hypothetical protein